MPMQDQTVTQGPPGKRDLLGNSGRHETASRRITKRVPQSHFPEVGNREVAL